MQDQTNDSKIFSFIIMVYILTVDSDGQIVEIRYVKEPMHRGILPAARIKISIPFNSNLVQP